MKSNLSDICFYVKDKIEVSSLDKKTYISTENMLPNKGGITTATSLPKLKKTRKFQKGDILVSNIRPYFKKIWFADFEGGCSNDVLVLRANEDVNSRFLYYVLADDSFFDYSTATSKGTKMPRGDKAAIMNYNVLLPPYFVQEKITKILGVLDDKIKLNNQINDNLFEIAITQFENINKKGIKFLQLKDLCSLISKGQAPNYSDDGSFIVLNQKCIRDHKINFSLSRNCKPPKDRNRILQFEDILINSTGQGTLGRSALLLVREPNLLADSHITIVRPKNNIYSFYLGIWAFLNQERFESMATGSTGQTDLPRDQLASLKLFVPSDEVLEEFDKLTRPLFLKIEQNVDENKKLSQIRDLLLNQIMSGELDVADLDI